MGESLRHLAARYRRVDLFVIDEIRIRWPEVVGATLAIRCVPELVREGVLVVRVPSGAFAERILTQERTILEGLSDLGDRCPTGIRTVVGEPPALPT